MPTRRPLILALAFALSLAGGGVVRAEEPAPQPTAEVKAAKAVTNQEPLWEGTSFPAGEQVFIWSRISNGKGTTIQHVWKKDGNQIWVASLPVRSDSWSTNSRRYVQPGQYEVEVRSQDGAVLGSVSFTVQPQQP
jgi:hypothetical protein